MMLLSLAVATIAVASSVGYSQLQPIDAEPETLAEMEHMLAAAKSPLSAQDQVEKPPPPPPPPPPSPAWTKFEQQYSTLLNATCAKVLTAAPAVPDADAASFMTAYKAFNGTGAEDAVFSAALKILNSASVEKFFAAPDSFSAGMDADMVLCAVLQDATPAGLATFSVNKTANPALVTQLLADAELMHDMLVAGGAKVLAAGRHSKTASAAQYGRAMEIYTQILKESTVLSESSAAGLCTFKAGCDYGHGSRTSGPATTQEQCCSLCSARSGCAAGVWDGTACWFKTARDVKGGCHKSSRVKQACIPPSVKPGPSPAPAPKPAPPPPPGLCPSFKTQPTCPVTRCTWTKAGACAVPAVPPPIASPWDSRDQSTVLKRMALGIALEHAVPLGSKWDGGKLPIDPVARYLHYETAYKAGDLDPQFEVLSTWELRLSMSEEAPDDDVAWMRQTMKNYRPDHVVLGGHGRYIENVHTEVAYGDPVWPDGRPDYKDIAAADGVCGPRAWFGRFCYRSFGLPTWGAAQPGHAAMTSWSLDGWAVELGATWSFCTWGGRGGVDFYLEARAREFRGEFQHVLRATWLATARGDAKVNPGWSPTRGAKSMGEGDLWYALALYAKKVSVEVTHQGEAPERVLGPSVVPTKVGTLINKWKSKPVIAPVSTGADGTIVIPAEAYTWHNKSGPSTMHSADAGNQILHGGGSPTEDPASTAWSYEVEVEAAAEYYLTANITTWHMNTHLFLNTNSTAAKPIEVPVYYTVGYWNITQPVEVQLVKGTNVLKFDRGHSTRELAFKSFSLSKTKPTVAPPPSNHTPTPPPPSPPPGDFIELPAGTDCLRQGIKDLNAYECQVSAIMAFNLSTTTGTYRCVMAFQQAAYHFGYKDTGSKSRPNQIVNVGVPLSFALTLFACTYSHSYMLTAAVVSLHRVAGRSPRGSTRAT